MLITVPRQCQLRYDNISDPRLLRLFENLPRSSSGTATSAWQFLQGLAVRRVQKEEAVQQYGAALNAQNNQQANQQ